MPGLIKPLLVVALFFLQPTAHDDMSVGTMGCIDGKYIKMSYFNMLRIGIIREGLVLLGGICTLSIP